MEMHEEKTKVSIKEIKKDKTYTFLVLDFSSLWHKMSVFWFSLHTKIKFLKQTAPFTSDLPLELDSVCFDFSKIRISNVRIKDRCCLNGFSKNSFKQKTSIKHANIIFQKPSESMALKWFCCNLKGI